MTKEELAAFVENCPEDEKNKIIEILNSYVDPNQMEEEKIPSTY